MAQKIYWNYKGALNSNDFNRVLLGILQPGRYRGFDIINVTGLNFDLVHTSTGIRQTKEDLSLTAETGILLTKQGFVIQEDALIALSCTTNAANAFVRRDIIVCEHEDVNVIGGQPAVYSVVRGTNGVTTAPALPNPNYQTLVGTIVIPASASNLSAATYEPAQAPLTGGNTLLGGNFPELNSTFVRLAATNNIQGQMKENFGSDLTVTAGKIVSPTGSNTFTDNSGSPTINEMDAIQPGTKIRILSQSTITINLAVTPTEGGLSIICPRLTAQSITQIFLIPGDYICLMQNKTSQWVIIDYSSVITNNEDWKTTLFTSNNDGILYKKDKFGFVEIYGVLSYATARTLPAYYRPALGAVSFTSGMVVANSGTVGGAGTIQVDIDTFGVITTTPALSIVGAGNYATVFVNLKFKATL